MTEEVYVFPMSFAQQRLWFLDQFEQHGTPFYNIPANLHISGSLNVGVLEQSINEIIHRHEILRTTFTMMDDEPVQVITPTLTITVQVTDLQKVHENEKTAKVRKLAAEEVKSPFNLAEGPLLRVTLLRLGEDEHVLLVTMHHIISDGWSMPIFIRELSALYEAFSLDKPSPLPELPIQYADYSSWQRELLQGDTLETQLNYWKQQLADAPPVIELPIARPRPAKISFQADKMNFEFGPEISRQLNEMGQQAGATLFMTLLTAFAVLLSRYSGQEDIVVGSPIANRNQAEVEPLIGFFVNTLVLRTNLSENPSFLELLERVRQVALNAYAHQDVPFEQLVEHLQPERRLNITPFFQVLFTLQNAPTEDMKLPGLTLNPLTDIETGVVRFELELYLWETPKGIQGEFIYKTDLFDSATIDRMIGHFKRLLAGIIANPNQRISELPLLTKAEEHQLLDWSNGGTKKEEIQNFKCIHQLFETQAEQTPDALAVVFEDQQLTYQALNNRANQLAHHMKTQGVALEELVGICVERSLEMMVGILGILKAGGAYMPLDPSYPKDRMAFMLEETGISVLLTQAHLEDRLPKHGTHKVCLDADWGTISEKCKDNPINETTADNLAYVIYTSGSTGQPKAIMIEHKNVHHMVFGLKERLYRQYSKKLKVALVAPYVFDASVQQIFGALLQGHSLYLVPEYSRTDGTRLLEFYQKHKTDISDGTPAHIRLLLESMEENPSSSLEVKHFIIGGEALPQQITAKFLQLLQQFSAQPPLITNVYGPAECCVDSTSFEVSAEIAEFSDMMVSIGRPLPNVRTYIVDRENNPQPIGVIGELCISGGGVGRGYLKREKLTDAKFTANPFQEGERWYRTGDLAKWRSDGNIAFVGRSDRQVKIRGFRIELGEIENTLMNYGKHSDSGIFLSEESVKVAENDVVTRCTRCLLPSNYPSINFDDKGICNICRKYDEYEKQAQNYFKEMDDFERLIEKARKTTGRGEYDCLLLFSGGKDSSYVLYRLVEMGLKVLTFTFDNGYISETAFENIRRMTSKLNVDNIIGKIENMPEVFRESIGFDHTVCTGCFKALTTMSTQVAHEKSVNVVITGLSRGQIFDTKLHALFEQDIFDPEEIEEKLSLFRKMYHARNDRISRLLSAELSDDVFDSLHFVDFFRYDNIRTSKIVEFLKTQDEYWCQPGDTGFCSTNCMINDVGIYTHIKNKGFHNYAAPLSWDVRLGRNSREEGLKELAFDPKNPIRIHDILNEIRYFTEIKDAFVLNRKDVEGNVSLCAYFVSNRKITVSELREYLSKKLPDYMIPGHFLRMERIPLTPNGKVDLHALPEPGQERPELKGALVAPRTPTEETIATIWCDVLDMERIGVNDNFFELGGHSLRATQVVSRMRHTLQVEIPLRDFFEKPTIAELAERVVTEQLKQAEDEELASILAETDKLSDEEAKSLLYTESN